MTGPAQYQVTYDFTPELAKKGTLAFLWKRSTVLVIATPFFLLFITYFFFSPDFGGLAGIFLGILAVYWYFCLDSFRTSGGMASALGNPRIDIAFSEEGICFTSALATSSVKWPAIKLLFCTKDFVFLMRQGIANPSAIPMSALPDGAFAFLQSKVKASGGKIR